ncbi:hypothetical protein ACFYRC_21745 [Streptomyces sp. NPDC005279]|uniref:hypothetical protein n=1 Tax=Streptomyces sp. NPDC005279 TaxID=3364712 RepID=UPI00367E6DD8
MRRALSLPVLASLLLGAVACTTGEKKGDSSAEDATCNELLGEAGLMWLEGRTGGPGKVRLKNTDDLKKARSLFYDQVENWGPDDSGVPTFVDADVCRARTDVENPKKELALRYGPSVLPFDFPFGVASGVTPAPTVTPVNSAVKLVHGKDRDGRLSYRVYVKCKIPGMPTKQENEIPIEGELTDTLTGDTGARVHLTHLLHSAKVVADSFGCQNKPVVPAEPPTSVK